MRTRLLFILLLCPLASMSQIKNLQDIAMEYVKSGQFKQATEFISQTEQLDADSAEALLTIKAYCFYKLKNNKEARQTLTTIESYDISTPESDILNLHYINTDKDFDLLKERSTELLEQDPQVFYNSLKILSEKDLRSMAQNLENNIDTLDEDEVSANKTALAVIYFALSDYQHCYNALSSAIEDYPIGFSYYMMGKIKTQSQEYISATAYFNQAEAANFKTLSLYKDRSTAKGLGQDYKGAIEDLDICLQYEPSAELYYLRATTYTALMEYTQALQDINTAISIEDTIAQYHNQKGIIQTNLGNYAEAIMNFQTAMRLNPNLNYIDNNLAIALEKAGFAEQATTHYQKSIKRHPDHADSYFNLGRISYDKGNYKRAVKLLLRANDLNPRYADTQYLLGMAYIKIGKADKGCFYLNMAQENGSNQASQAIQTYCNTTPEPQISEEE